MLQGLGPWAEVVLERMLKCLHSNRQPRRCLGMQSILGVPNSHMQLLPKKTLQYTHRKVFPPMNSSIKRCQTPHRKQTTQILDFCRYHTSIPIGAHVPSAGLQISAQVRTCALKWKTKTHSTTQCLLKQHTSTTHTALKHRLRKTTALCCCTLQPIPGPAHGCDTHLSHLCTSSWKFSLHTPVSPCVFGCDQPHALKRRNRSFAEIDKNDTQENS